MPADRNQARELFLHAVGKLPPDEWDAYVIAASGGDAELRCEVEDMLRVHRNAGSFLERPALWAHGRVYGCLLRETRRLGATRHGDWSVQANRADWRGRDGEGLDGPAD